jgi:hypothetical protein
MGLPARPNVQDPDGGRRSQTPIDHRDIARKWRMDYTFASGDLASRGLDALHKLCSHLCVPSVDVKALCEEAATLIVKQFSLRDATIGLRSDKDGLFRYEVVVGMKKETEDAIRKLVYSEDDFLSDKEYKGVTISKYTRLYLAEDSPYADTEKDTYNHPVLLSSRRRSLTESLEGDYVDVHILGEKEELLGWIEMSGTRTGKLPDIHTIRWVEMISRILAVALINDASGSPTRKGFLARTLQGRG